MWAAVGSAVGLMGVIFCIALMASGTSSKLSETSPKKDTLHLRREPDPKPKPSPENPKGDAPRQPKGTDKPPNLPDIDTEIRDGGGFFSARAIEKANAGVKTIKRKFKKDLVIETYKELPEDLKGDYEKVAKDKEGRSRFFVKWGNARANVVQLNGVFIAIFKTPPHLTIIPDTETEKRTFTNENARKLRDLLVERFSNGKYDSALLEVIAKVHEAMEHSANESAGQESQPLKGGKPNNDTQARTGGEPTLGSNATLENIKKVRAGMTLDQVEQILGKGRKATEEDVREAKKQLEENKKKMEEASKRATGSLPQVAVPDLDSKPGTTKYRWGSKNTWLFVDVDDGTQRVVRTAAHSSW